TRPAVASTRFRARAIASSSSGASDSNVSAVGVSGEAIDGLSSRAGYLVCIGQSENAVSLRRSGRAPAKPQVTRTSPHRPMQLRLLEKQKDSVRIEILNPDDTIIYPLITGLFKDADE